MMPGGRLLDVRPNGPARMIKAIEERLALCAVCAVGVPPAGPWRLIVTADPRSPLKQAQFWNLKRLPLVVGALVLCEAKTWGEQVRAGAASILRIADTDDAFVLGSAEEMQRALVAAAQAAGAKAWDVYQHKERVEGLIQKEMAL